MAFNFPLPTDDSGNDVSGTPVDAAWVQTLIDYINNTWPSAAYTPTWSGTAFALGNGTSTGTKFNIGKLYIFEAILTLGSTTVIGADLSVSLPATAVAALTGELSLQVNDASAGGATYNSLDAIISSTTTAICLTIGSPAGAVNTTTPITFATSDTVKVRGWFFAA